ncbi:hypothetical protein ABG768_016898 [Culter alburnus]|uniref:Uncharacterized protein n=1 Tax=Culter alburnus TaxID=194366 RepID=A0AAW1YWH1_CULAL
MLSFFSASRDSRRLQRSTLCNNTTTDGKVTLTKNKTEDLVSSDSTSCPEFIQDLLPSAERTALLYHLSYLCLGSFPELERLIRERAVETQLLFGSSEALLLKCAGTSENLVELLLPSLKVAAEKNKPELALKFLEKAKGWISDIITDVNKIVKRYEEHYRDVDTTTSNIITEKKETEKKQQQQTSEMKELQKIIDGLEAKLLSISKRIDDYEKKIEEKNAEIQKIIISIAGRSFFYSIFVLFVESMISRMRFSPEEDQLRALYADLSKTTEAQKSLIEEEWNIQNQLMENRLKLAKLQIENGQMPSVTHLNEVQKSLSRIQHILVRLQNTFTGEIWIEDLTDMKEEFLESIDAAEEGWTKFGISCLKANNILSVQANQAYRFLEISPSSLSEEEWQKEYDSVNEKLQNIKPNAVCPT